MSTKNRKLKRSDRRLIKELCYSTNYEILSGTTEKPIHIRLNDFGVDVWATTGTLKDNKGVFHRGGHGLVFLGELLGRKIEYAKTKMNTRIEHLESQVSHLTECMEDMQFTIESLTARS